jgi:FkbM family methyltransferase
MENTLTPSESWLARLRHHLIPASARKVGLYFYQTALWRLGLGQFPGITKKPIDTAFLRRLIKKEDPVILEIGASDGEHTQWFINSFRDPKVYCFGPEPRAFTRHQNLIGNHPAVSLFPVAISDQVGTIEFYQSSGTPPWDGFDHIKDSGWDFSGSIKKPKGHLEALPWVKFETSIQVPTTTIDLWLREQSIPCVDMIWMDVQGAERNVLEGMRDSLSQIRYIYTEYNDQELYEGQPTLLEILDLLPTFKIIKRFKDDVLLGNRAVG